jgi:hypothetical protein
MRKRIWLLVILFSVSATAKAEDFNMFSAIRSAGSFSQGDLAGIWAMHALSMDGDDILWLTGELSIDENGFVSMVSGVDSENQTIDITDGKLILNPSGFITGRFFLEDSKSTEFFVQNGKLDAAPSGGIQLNNYAILIASCRNCSPDRSLLVYLTRSGFTGFEQVDAGGFWQLYGTGFENDSNRLFWVFGSFQIDSFGKVVTGSFQIQKSNGQRAFFSSGQVNVEQNGEVTGFFEGTGTSGTTTFAGGQMTTDFNQITLVSANTQNEKLLIVLIYSGDNQSGGFFADTDIDGSWRYYGIRFDQPAADAEVSWEFGGLDMEDKGTITGDDYVDREGKGGSISGDQIEIEVGGNLVNGEIQLDGISRMLNAGRMNIPPFSASANPKTRFTFVGTDTGGSGGGGGGGGGNVGVLPALDIGDSGGCMISSVLAD